jgi:transposase
MIPSNVTIYMASSPIDMRRSFDGLSELIRNHLQQDPRNGSLYVFFNKKLDRLKIVWAEGSGDCLLYKRLHRRIFRLPQLIPQGATSMAIDARELAHLLEGIPLPSRRETAREIAHLAREMALKIHTKDSIDPSS